MIGKLLAIKGNYQFNMNFKFHWIENNAIISFEGEISFEDIDQANNMIYGDARFDLMDFAIFDFRNIHGLNLT